MMRYTPFESMDRLFEQMRRDMLEWRESVGGDWPAFDLPAFGPSMDLTEHDDEFVFTADLPGFERNEIDLRVDDDALILSATHRVGDEGTADTRSVHERVRLPKPVEVEEVSAVYRNGVLEAHLPIVDGAAPSGTSIDIE